MTRTSSSCIDTLTGAGVWDNTRSASAWAGGAGAVSSKLVEGCQVYTELGPGQGAGARGRTKEAGEAGGQRISAEIGHTDWLTDMILCQSQQTLLVTASNDGVMKIWK